jgi:hypothetical protein
MALKSVFVPGFVYFIVFPVRNGMKIIKEMYY